MLFILPKLYRLTQNSLHHYHSEIFSPFSIRVVNRLVLRDKDSAVSDVALN